MKITEISKSIGIFVIRRNISNWITDLCSVSQELSNGTKFVDFRDKKLPQSRSRY